MTKTEIDKFYKLKTQLYILGVYYYRYIHDTWKKESIYIYTYIYKATLLPHKRTYEVAIYIFMAFAI